MPKADGSLTNAELAAGYFIPGTRVAVGKRGKLWAWSCFDCAAGALVDGQPTADFKASSHKCP